MQSLRKLRLPALGCSAIFLFCELIARPWAELGIADDWSYIYIAQTVARTGHIAYDGWVTPLLGWQLYLAAASFKIFGFSFTAARMTTLLVAVATVFLMQRTFVRLGLKSLYASLATLTLALTPMFLMLSVTFMTDIPGLFAVLLCLYGCLRALQAATDRAAILWLCFAIATNCICGSSRQIAWLGVLVLVPSTLWLLRTRRAVLLPGIIATALGFAFVFTLLHWFGRQPYIQHELFSLPPLKPYLLSMVMLRYERACLEAILCLLPIGILFAFDVKHWRLRELRTLAFILISLAAVAAIGVELIHWPISFLKDALDPFPGDWLSVHGTYEGIMMLGYQQKPPVVIGHLLQHLIGFITVASLLCIVVTLLRLRTARSLILPDKTLTWKQVAYLLGPFAVAYTLLLLHRAEQQIYDRYMLLPMVLVGYVLLRFYQERMPPRPLPAAFAVLAVIAGYGVLSTHNLFALDRARVILNNEILASGVAPSSVDFGWDADGWFELQQYGHVNGPLVSNPAHAVLPIVDPFFDYCYGQTIAFGLYPHLAPRYGVSFKPDACSGAAPFAPVTYSTWPLRHPTMLYVVNFPPPWRPESDYVEHRDASRHP